MIKTFIKAFVFIGLISLANLAKAQQDPYFTHWRYNKILYNPAFAGFGNKHCIGINSHNQWVGFEDQSKKYLTESGLPADLSPNSKVAPVTQSLHYHGIIYGMDARHKDGIKDHSINGSLAYANDKIAYETNTYIKAGLAFNYELDNGSSFRLGVALSSVSKKIDGTKLRAHDPLDPLIPVGVVNDNQNTVDAGLYYFNPAFKSIWAGISTTNIINKTFSLNSLYKVNSAKHYYIMAGLELDNFLGNPNLSLSPAVLIKTGVKAKNSPVTPQLDLNGVVTYVNTYEGGINVRGQATGMDGVCFLLGYYPPFPKGNGKNAQNMSLRIGYSYDWTLNKIRTVSNGTHEVQVNFCFPIKIPVAPELKRHNTIYMDPSPELKSLNPKNI